MTSGRIGIGSDLCSHLHVLRVSRLFFLRFTLLERCLQLRREAFVRYHRIRVPSIRISLSTLSSPGASEALLAEV